MTPWHLTLATDGRLPMAPTEDERRAIVRAILRLAGPSLALFSVVDDHLHLVVLATRDEVGRLSRALALGLRPLCRASLEAVRVRPVESRGHASWLAQHYIAVQPLKHGLPDHPALYSGSCFQDLVGARVGPTLRIVELLPRFRLRELLPAVGLPVEPIQPPDAEQIRSLGAARVALAAAAAACAPPELDGRTALVVAARRAAAQLAEESDIGRAETGFALGLSPSGLRKLLKAPVDAALCRAARVRLGLELAVAAAPPLVREPEEGYRVEGWEG